MATEIEAYIAKNVAAPADQKSKAKSTKASKEKKSAVAKKPRVHPPYLDMIKEAISSLKERTGSSQYAIAKFIEDKQKDLPPNFKKLLLVQLRKLVATGKLTKVKNSFKLSAPVKSPAAAPVVKKASTEKKVVAKKVTAKPKKATAAAAKVKKATAATPVKAKKKVVKKAAVEKKPKKVAKTAKVTTPGKKKAVEKVVPAKKAPVKKTVKKVKSLKSPAKKAVAKKGKK